MADALLFSSPLRPASTKLEWGYCDHASEPAGRATLRSQRAATSRLPPWRRRLAQETRYQRISGKETHYGLFMALHIFWVGGLVS